MKQTAITKPQIKLVGMCVRTSNQQEFNTTKPRISPLVQRYFHEQIFKKIPHRLHPGTTLCAYTDYESDYHGPYTYFIGEEVASFDTPLPQGLQTLIIPGQQYMKFTTNPAPMPDVIIQTWQQVWNMSPEQLGGTRRYHTDFELYDERAHDHHNVVCDLYIGIN